MKQLKITTWLVGNASYRTQCDAVDEGNNLTSGVEGVDVEWPLFISRVPRNLNPHGVAFEDLSFSRSQCVCVSDCTATCLNKACGIFCSVQNCGVGARCGNHIVESTSLTLVRSYMGYGVVTKCDLESNMIVGEYCGVLVDERRFDDEMARSGFCMRLKCKSEQKRTVYVDASRCGTLSRFMNHACVPNCRFEEMVNRRERGVAIITNDCIRKGCELTVSYRERVWFEYCCRHCVC
jgi:SET domain